MVDLILELKKRGLKDGDYFFTKAGNLNFSINGRKFQFSKTGWFRAMANQNSPRGNWKHFPAAVKMARAYGGLTGIAGRMWYIVFKEFNPNAGTHEGCDRRKAANYKDRIPELIARIDGSGILNS